MLPTGGAQLQLLLLLLVLVVASSSSFTQAKTVTGRFLLTAGDLVSGPEYEISKFSFVVGKGQIRGTFKYEDPHTWMTSPALYLFRDESWPAYHAALTCEDKAALAFKAIHIGQQTQSHLKLLKRQLDEPAKVTLERAEDGSDMIQWKFSWEFDTEERTTGWFLIAADCALEQFNAQVPAMQYEIELLNPDNTHLPADEFGLPKLYLLTFCFLVLFAGKLVFVDLRGGGGAGGKKKGGEEEKEKTQLVVYLLFFGYFTLTASLGCELAHLYVYRQNGRGVYLFDLLSDVFDGVCQLTVAFVLICLASGWTLVEMEDDSVKKNSVGSLLRHPQNLVKGGNMVSAVIITLVVFSFVLQYLNKQMDEAFTKFHDYDSLPGKLLVLLHFALGLFFAASMVRTLRHPRLKGKLDLQLFLRRLLLLGTIYFLCFPMWVFVAQNMVAHYNRHRVVSGGVLLVQAVCLLSLANQFTSNSSQYHKLSVLADIGALGGGLVGAPVSKAARD